jgi:hypothetical protein
MFRLWWSKRTVSRERAFCIGAVFGDGEKSKPVRHLLALARANGRAAYYVQSTGFDDLMLRLALHCLEGEAVDEARRLMTEQAPTPTEARADFTIADLPKCGLIKSNAFLLTPPGEVYEFDLKEWPEGKVWEYCNNCTDGKPLVAVPFKKAYAFGSIDDIRTAFADRIGEKIEGVPINDIDLRYDDSALASLIRLMNPRGKSLTPKAKLGGRYWARTSEPVTSCL